MDLSFLLLSLAPFTLRIPIRHLVFHSSSIDTTKHVRIQSSRVINLLFTHLSHKITIAPHQYAVISDHFSNVINMIYQHRGYKWWFCMFLHCILYNFLLYQFRCAIMNELFAQVGRESYFVWRRLLRVTINDVAFRGIACEFPSSTDSLLVSSGAHNRVAPFISHRTFDFNVM